MEWLTVECVLDDKLIQDEPMRGWDPRNFVELHGLELLFFFIWSSRIWAWGWQRRQWFIHWDGLMRR